MFYDVQFPTSYSLRAKGGGLFLTTIIPAKSGKESRNKDWKKRGGRWTIDLIGKEETEWDEVNNLFHVCGGQGDTFRFKDWKDYLVTNGNIGTGDDSTSEFRLRKLYEIEGGVFERIITKPVEDTLTLLVDTSTQTINTDFTIDWNTGIITFTTPPANGEIITATFEFDVHARFGMDNQDGAYALFPGNSAKQLHNWERIIIMEEKD